MLLLAPGGRVAYFGPPAGLLPFFGVRDHADVFTAVAADPEGVAHRFRSSALHDEQVAGPLRSPRGLQPPQEPPRQQSIPAQLSTLARRHLRVIAADRGYAGFMVLLPVALALLTMVVPGRFGLSFTTDLVQGTPVPASGVEASQVLVILIIGSVFMGTAVSVRELIGERAIFKRERAVGLSSTGYVAAKLFIFGAMTLLQSVVLVLLVETRKSPPSSAVALGSPTLELILACWLTALAAMALGLVMSAVVRTSEQVMPLLVVSIMAQLVLCGGLFPVAGRAVLEQVAWLTPARWGFALGATTADLNRFTLKAKDALWDHSVPNGALAASVLLVLTLCFAAVTLWRLDRDRSE